MRSLLCMAGLLASCFLSVAVHAEPPPAEIFGGLPLSEIGRLSPDGKHLAAIQPIKGRNGVMIYDLSIPTAQPHAVALDQAVAEDFRLPSRKRFPDKPSKFCRGMTPTESMSSKPKARVTRR